MEETRRAEPPADTGGPVVPGEGRPGDVRLLTLARDDGSELRVEWQPVPRDRPAVDAVVSLRLWRPDGDGDRVPGGGRGFSLRDRECRPVIAALVEALDRFRAREWRRRRALESARYGRAPR